jgi:hypothetical protein
MGNSMKIAAANMAYYAVEGFSWAAVVALLPVSIPAAAVWGREYLFMPFEWTSGVGTWRRKRVEFLKTGKLDRADRLDARVDKARSPKRMELGGAGAVEAKPKASAPAGKAQVATGGAMAAIPRSELSDAEKLKLDEDLGSAAKALDAKRCRELMDRGADPAFDLDGHGMTSVYVWAEAHALAKKEMKEAALEAGRALLSVKGNPGASEALADWAHLSFEAVDMLLENGADPNRASGSGSTPLLNVCKAYMGNARSVDRLLAAGADAGAAQLEVEKGRGIQREPLGTTALMQMARWVGGPGDLESKAGEISAAVGRLVAAGAGVDAVDMYGSTALHYAAREMNALMVNALLDHGAKPCVMDGEGETPLEAHEAPGRFDLPAYVVSAFERLAAEGERWALGEEVGDAGGSELESAARRL